MARDTVGLSKPGEAFMISLGAALLVVIVLFAVGVLQSFLAILFALVDVLIFVALMVAVVFHGNPNRRPVHNGILEAQI